MNKPVWPSPTDLRCVGGPADGKWFAVPPEGYHRRPLRGGSVWMYERPGLTYQAEFGGGITADTLRVTAPFPRSALPGESV